MPTQRRGAAVEAESALSPRLVESDLLSKYRSRWEAISVRMTDYIYHRAVLVGIDCCSVHFLAVDEAAPIV